MGKWWRAVGSLLALIGLLAGLPVVLIRIAGWPLPTKVPDWDHVAQMVQQGDLPAPAVLKTLAVLLWVAWLMVLWAFLWEVAKSLPSTSRAEPARPSAPLVPAAVSDGVGRLVAAVLALGLLAPSDTAAATTGLPETVMVAATADMETPATATFTPATIRAASTEHREWLVTGSDTLWDVAATALGDGTRVTEIIDLNRGLRPERHLRAGQVLDLPADASIPASRRPVTADATTADGTPTRSDDDSVVEATTIIIEPGDTLWDETEQRLQQAGVEPTPAATADYLVEVIDANPDVVDDPNLIYAGDQITMPALDLSGEDVVAPAADPATGNTPPVAAHPQVDEIAYTVVDGDTLWDILDAHYGEVDADMVWDIAARNGLEDPDSITTGQVLTLPTTVGAPQTVPPATAAPSAPAATPDAVEAEPEPASTSPAIPPVAAAPTGPPTRTPPQSEAVETPSTDVVDAGEATPLPGPARRPAAAAEPPATVQFDAAQNVDSVDVADGLFDVAVRSVWWTVPMGALLASGIVTMMRRLRGRRLQSLEPGEQLAVTPPVAAGTELAAAVSSPRRRVATLQVLLRSVTPHARELDDPPSVRAVELGEDRVEVLFTDPAPFPPAGWSSGDGGRSWTHRAADGEVAATRQLVTPALVTLGRRDGGGEVLLDLETAGSLGLVGHRPAALGMARSIVMELATYPLGVPLDVCLVGVDVDGVEHCDRAWTNVTMVRALRVAREMLERTTATAAKSLIAARAALDEDLGELDPHVFVVDRDALGDADDVRLGELIALCQPQAGAAVVVVGGHRDAREVVELDDTGSTSWSGAVLRAPVVSREAVAQLAMTFDHAANAPAEPLTSSMVVTDLLPAAAAQATAEAGPEPVEAAADAVPVLYVEPERDVVVCLLGEVHVEGVDVTAAAQVELLALLTCLRDRRPNVDTVTTLLTDGDSVRERRPRVGDQAEPVHRVIQRRVSKLRARLGVGADGEPLLPAAPKGPNGPCAYRVSRRVLTDVELLEHRYQASLQLASGDARVVLRDGLELLAGPALRARKGYGWAFPEGVMARIYSIVTAYAGRLMELAFEADELELVLETVRRAGRVIDDPVAETPMRRLEREYAKASGNPDLLASADEAHRRLLDYRDEFDAHVDDT